VRQLPRRQRALRPLINNNNNNNVVCVCVRQIVHISVGRHFGVSSLGHTLANMREELSDKELVKRIRNARFF